MPNHIESSDLMRIEAAHAKTPDTLAQFGTRLAILEERVADLRRDREMREWKRWTLAMTVMIGMFVTCVVQLAVTLLRD